MKEQIEVKCGDKTFILFIDDSATGKPMVDKYKQVTKDEFQEFVAGYPVKLEYDVTGISDPPYGTWNDFTGGKVWPESIVAKVALYDGGEYYGGKQPEYFIKTN